MPIRLASLHATRSHSVVIRRILTIQYIQSRLGQSEGWLLSCLIQWHRLQRLLLLSCMDLGATVFKTGDSIVELTLALLGLLQLCCEHLSLL
jgi:hypothetical protein